MNNMMIQRLMRSVCATTTAVVLGIACLCALSLISSITPSVLPSLPHGYGTIVLDSTAHAQTFGQRSNDRKSDSRRRRADDSRRANTGQSSHAQRDVAMDEVKRRFPGARVLKLNDVGDSVFRARILTSDGKVKVVNVRAGDR